VPKERDRFAEEHVALIRIVQAVQGEGLRVPLSFTDLYEASKINGPVRRDNLSQVPPLINGETVLRGRRCLLRESLIQLLTARYGLNKLDLQNGWFMSNLRFEAVSDYSAQPLGSISRSG
jgi:hypothetical protein